MSYTHIRAGLIAMTGCLLAASCASTDEERESRDPLVQLAEDARLGERADRICFTGNIDSFSMASDRSVVIEAGVRDYYLLTFATHCQNLDFAQSLSFDAFGPCLTRGDSIKAYDTVFGGSSVGQPSMSCLIQDIYEWNPDAADEPAEEGEDDAADS